MCTPWLGRLLGTMALLLLCTNFSPCQALEQQEIDALKNIYHANPSLMNTFGWSSNSSSACDVDSSWNQTITCQDNHIAEISISPEFGQKVFGFPFSSEWGNFQYLRVLTLVSLNITGTIPHAISRLSALESLGLRFNQLTGSIPDLTATNISVLDLSFNALSGPIPHNLLSIPTLQHVYIWSNLLNGTIPNTNWNPGLVSLVLGHNRLSGSIPEIIGSMANLKALLLDANKLTGTIPQNLFQAPIEYFSIVDNRLDVCTGKLIPGPVALSACTVLPQYFDQKNCSCGAKWANKCGEFPTECPTCPGPQPTPEFSCSTTEAGWWAERVLLPAGRVADFTGTSAAMPALVLDELVAEPGSTMKFGFNSELRIGSAAVLNGLIKIDLTEADTDYLLNQISGDYFHKQWQTVTRTVIAVVSFKPQTDVVFRPTITIPHACHYVSTNAAVKPIVNPFEVLTSYEVTYQTLPSVRFKCSSWIIVIGVFGGAIIVTLVVFIGCVIYTKGQKAKQKRDTTPLLR